MSKRGAPRARYSAGQLGTVDPEADLDRAIEYRYQLGQFDMATSRSALASRPTTITPVREGLGGA